MIHDRAEVAACVAQDSQFDCAKTCIRFRKDDGSKPDIWIGRDHARVKQKHGASDWIWATEVAKLVIEDRRGAPRRIAVASAVSWEKIEPFPLLPVKGAFNGTPATPPGLP